MLDFNELARLLEGCEGEFTTFRDEAQKECQFYHGLLQRLSSLDLSAISSCPDRCGARPLEPVGDGFFVDFDGHWSTRDECLEWVHGVLGNATVAAIDGGQIYPGPASGASIALLQAGIARSSPGSGLRMETRLQVMGPDALEICAQAEVSMNGYVDARRFGLECSEAGRLLEENERSTVLMDYPLLVPHLLGYPKALRETYLKSILGLLRAARASSGCVAGFVDVSVARDVVTMLHRLLCKTERSGPIPTRWLTDAFLLSRNAAWGRRTKALLLDRHDHMGGGGVSTLDLYEEFSDGVGFFYVCTDGSSFSRVEFPRRIFEEGRLDELVNVILAQTALRGNYPDILVHAHRAASITQGEAEMFQGIIDRFYAETGILWRKGPKEMHKRFTASTRFRQNSV